MKLNFKKKSSFLALLEPKQKKYLFYLISYSQMMPLYLSNNCKPNLKLEALIFDVIYR